MYDYEVYPKVVCDGKNAQITIRALGARAGFVKGEMYRIVVKALHGGNPTYYPASADYESIACECREKDMLVFSHTFFGEQMFFLDVTHAQEKGVPFRERFSVYCVHADLAQRIPLLGDFHLHTTYSDGMQTPEAVCADYRRHGYDFLAITDHRRFDGSLRARRFYEPYPIDLMILSGEEVHLPPAFGKEIHPHIVHVGGAYSINALMERDPSEHVPTDPMQRSVHGMCPAIMDQAAYEAQIAEQMRQLHIPENIDSVPAAGMVWAFQAIRESGGIGIFPHPNWIDDVYHVPDALCDFLVDTKAFDAFEVLGGENYYEQNGFQTARYNEDRARGKWYPVVGSTDSHNANPTNRNALICSTLLFSSGRDEDAVLRAVRDGYCVAVDTISDDFRIVGESRFVRYACFLLKEYFPLHDELCFEEGRAMKQLATGTEEEKREAAAWLSMLRGRVERLQRKCFAMSNTQEQ